MVRGLIMDTKRSYCIHCRRRTPNCYLDFPEDGECEVICAVCDQLKQVRRRHPSRRRRIFRRNK